MAAPKSPDGLPLVTAEPRIGKEVVYGTHNFADKTTWFGSSVRVVAEAAIDSGNGLTWNLSNTHVIDMLHGKIFDEAQYVLDQIAANPGDPHGYNVVVRVDGVVQTMREPFATNGGDYYVDYANGRIVFFASKAGSVVTVDYSHATDSSFRIVPDPGFDIDIESAKAMYSEDFTMNDAVCFEIWGYAAVFAPQLNLPPGVKVQLGATHYRTLRQLASESSDSTLVAPAAGGADRGISSALHALHFRYGTIRRLESAYGLELVVRTEHDLAMGGSHASATFYCVVRAVPEAA
jgi:hypothetical protein